MMKEKILKSIYSVRKTIDPYKRKFCFEMFGYDFILDEDFNVFLIEVNTNPCLEESSQLLKDMLPRMIEDMLKLTVDQVFPKINKKKKIQPNGGVNSPPKGKKIDDKLRKDSKLKSYTKNLPRIEEEDKIDHVGARGEKSPSPNIEELEDEKQKKAQRRIYPVEGYEDNENMWEKMINVEKCAVCPPS